MSKDIYHVLCLIWEVQSSKVRNCSALIKMICIFVCYFYTFSRVYANNEKIKKKKLVIENKPDIYLITFTILAHKSKTYFIKKILHVQKK
jgi:hypothetical protein